MPIWHTAKAAGKSKSIQLFTPIYNRNKDLYDAIKNVVGPQENQQLSCSVVTLSACQDSQTTPAGDVLSLFTYNLSRAWDSGGFGGSYRQFHRSLADIAPSNATPAINPYGTNAAQGEALREAAGILRLQESSNDEVARPRNMTSSSRQLWPFGGRAAAFAVPAILISLLLFTACLARSPVGRATRRIERANGHFLAQPVTGRSFFADSFADRGAVLEYMGLKLDFSPLSATTVASAKMPSNIGSPGHLTDSGTMEILTALSSTVDHDVVVVDLHGGDAWWETRLLV